MQIIGKSELSCVTEKNFPLVKIKPTTEDAAESLIN